MEKTQWDGILMMKKSLVLIQPSVSISLGSERDLVFRNKINKETLSIPQTNGCLILIDGKTQKNWQHSIKKTQKIIGPRINLTFRNIIITK